MVLAYNPCCRYARCRLEFLSHRHGDSRVPTGWIVLAASFTAALRRLTEVLLGKWHFQPSPGRHYPVPTYTYDMETTNVKKKQDFFDRCLRSWCLVRKWGSNVLQAVTKHLKASAPQVFCGLHIFGSLSLTTSPVRFTIVILELPSNSLVGTVAIPSIWTSLEPGLGIICGCLPTFPALFRRWSELYSSKRHRSNSKLLSLKNNRFLNIRQNRKDNPETDFPEDSTAYLRFDQDTEAGTELQSTKSRSAAREVHAS